MFKALRGEVAIAEHPAGLSAGNVIPGTCLVDECRPKFRDLNVRRRIEAATQAGDLKGIDLFYRDFENGRVRHAAPPLAAARIFRATISLRRHAEGSCERTRERSLRTKTA